MMENSRTGGDIYAFNVGLGKTITTITLVERAVADLDSNGMVRATRIPLGFSA